jgi:hypothetical protein
MIYIYQAINHLHVVRNFIYIYFINCFLHCVMMYVGIIFSFLLGSFITGCFVTHQTFFFGHTYGKVMSFAAAMLVVMYIFEVNRPDNYWYDYAAALAAGVQNAMWSRYGTDLTCLFIVTRLDFTSLVASLWHANAMRLKMRVMRCNGCGVSSCCAGILETSCGLLTSQARPPTLDCFWVVVQ